MSFAVFTLVGGERIALRPHCIESLCEIKAKPPKKNCGTNIRVGNDEAGWEVKETFDQAILLIQQAEAQQNEDEKAP